MEQLRAPFPWFGGKRRVADLVWARLGDVDTYNEPFAGSLAVLLGRPHEARVETVNDLDCYLANFWRALQHDPDGVAYHADGPVNEADLHARHRWLVESARATAERALTEPDFYDVKIAGWWVWGQCLWIGSGWCQNLDHRKPYLAGGNGSPNRGVHKKRFTAHDHRGVHRRWQGGGQDGGSGVHAPRLSQQRWAASPGANSGVHAPRLSQQKPLLRDANGMGVLTGTVQSEGLYEYLQGLSIRLRRVRVCCGDWKRVLTPSVTTYVGLTGVFLDPPYSHDMRERCYSEDHDISAEVREWAIANGDNPQFRIALCGYEGEHDMPSSWETVTWKAHGGYSRSERGVANRDRERIWFSPHCLKADLPLFMEIA